MKSPDAAMIRRRRRRERVVILAVLTVVLVLGSLQGWLFHYQSELPLFGNVLLIALVNINLILLLLLLYLVIRQLVKLVFERKKGVLGHRLRTRLTLAFVALTLIPTVPLFGVAVQFMSLSLDYWFSAQVEQSLAQSVELGKGYVRQVQRDLLQELELVEAEVFPQESAHENGVFLFDVPPMFWQRHQLDAVFVVDGKGKALRVVWQRPEWARFETALAQTIQERLRDSRAMMEGLLMPLGEDGDALVVWHPLREARHEPFQPSYLGVLRKFPPDLAAQLNTVVQGYQNYRQLKLFQAPLKITYVIAFSIVTLLVAFAAIWFGLYLARHITGPIQSLLTATNQVAQGDLGVSLHVDREDEMGLLMASFNHMVRDLRANREQLTQAYQALQESHMELEARRRYMEIVLANIGAGVVGVDADGRVRAMNKAAEQMSGIRADEITGRHYGDFLQPEHMDVVKSFLRLYGISRQTYLEKQVEVLVGNRPLALLVKVSVLQDENQRPQGAVVVLDDLSELQRAQRAAAWREVARRIAHEIKNPLTPIRLSAQRLQRRCDKGMAVADTVVRECTETIIQQVDHMKRLVNEFSQFARMPEARPQPCNLKLLAQEAVTLYRHTYTNIRFHVTFNEDFPDLLLDPDQFRQVLNNLLENAVQALNGQEGEVEIRLDYDPILKIARLECADTGPGLSVEAKARAFEPYYSTREKGTGLGLAIVAKIVADHHGFVRLRDNEPRGTVFVIELPATFGDNAP
ncbi:sensor histidine kinase [Desulfosoma caldarium]|uniref:histidine kinase n=1 Tax=Desulfosoma caldarium TaxID=610254 RepID=A0A3N1VNJ1_9BACT|nr:ATP-binding protein [Desulfosoma caldarium]ROR01782.1 PAS/PAC sensor signal transduction histidine kinase [Desulfosoma caldarium]